MGKQFHIGDVLSITDGRLVSPSHMDGVSSILSYMTRDVLWTHQLPRAMEECKPHLLRQHPFLAGPEMAEELARLDVMLDAASGKEATEAAVNGWLAGVVKRFGETLNVEPIPRDDHEVKNPWDELVAMRGTDEGIIPVVVAGDREPSA